MIEMRIVTIGIAAEETPEGLFRMDRLRQAEPEAFDWLTVEAREVFAAAEDGLVFGAAYGAASDAIG